MDKLRATNKQVSTISGAVASNRLGESMGMSGKMSDETLNPSGKKISAINGSKLCIEREGKDGMSGRLPSPNIEALRTTNKSVSAIGGAVARNQLGK